ncbi:hypothetical protein JTB14_026910 [Gonioctena quinquepunctata]|nr:hypothetical protein JTB14_026910 [Gonioctena quinquepunctata]
MEQAKGKFLIDTGSQISCIKVRSLDDDAVIHDEFKVNLNGISNGTVETLGIHFSKIQLTNSINIDHSFQVVKKDFPLKNFDGILGRDFLKKYKANLDLHERTLSFSINNETILLQLENNNHDNDISIPAKSEKIIKVKVDKNEEMVCMKQEISEGVYVGAGDTTAYSMTWMLYLLSKNKHIQEDLRQQLQQDEKPPILKNVVKESLRLYPVAPFLTRFVPETLTVCGYSIPPPKL